MSSYIDKDVAVSIVRLCFSEHGKFETHSSLMNFICTSLSADVTTADVKPVVHAHWIAGNSPGFYYCSNCDRAAANIVEWAQKYCFHCGAKMDEGEG